MSDAPRWPGMNGSPGLDFSPKRQEPASEATPSRPEPQDAGANEDTAVRDMTSNDWLTRSIGSAEPATPSPMPVQPPSTGATETPAPAAVVVEEPSKADEKADEKAAAKAEAKARKAAGATDPYPVPRGARRTRKARLRLSRIDPWSVMKTTFLFSIAFGIMTMVIAWVLWTVFESSGALPEVNKFITILIGSESGQQFRIEDILNGSRVLGFAAILAAIDVVILTAVVTLFAFLYNLAATVIGGLEVTLAED